MPDSKKKLLLSGSILGMALVLGSGAKASVQSDSDALTAVPQSAMERLIYLGYPNSDDVVEPGLQVAKKAAKKAPAKKMAAKKMATKKHTNNGKALAMGKGKAFGIGQGNGPKAMAKKK